VTIKKQVQKGGKRKHITNLMPVLPFTRQRNPFEVELLNDQTEGRECHLPSNISLRPSSQFLGTDSRYLKDAGLTIESE